jgi:hypothetical protein
MEERGLRFLAQEFFNNCGSEHQKNVQFFSVGLCDILKAKRDCLNCIIDTVYLLEANFM